TADDPPAATAEKPVAGKPADAATRMRVANNLKQILIAIHAYHDANNRFPADIVGKDGKPLLSWRVAILPYIEQDAVYRAFKLDEPWDSENNKQLIRQMPQQYRLPGQPRDDTKTYYQGLAGPGTLFEARKKITLASVTDGTSNTLAVVVAGDPVEWAKPADIPFDPKAVKVPASPYANVLLAAIADGSVRTMGTKITPGLFSKLAVRDDGEVIDPNEFPKPEARATTKEDREYAAKLAARNQELAAEIGRLLEERKKVLAEAVRQKAGPGADIEALVAAQDGLERMIEQLKEENERLKEGGEGRRPTPQSPTPAKPIIKR
ncbi:MAG: DUF1559 domain-containing protein, partial [Gemmataceae bacterium]|nr:DUF1559 domain-containing protein [Gemmataceae bacterium]